MQYTSKLLTCTGGKFSRPKHRIFTEIADGIFEYIQMKMYAEIKEKNISVI